MYNFYIVLIWQQVVWLSKMKLMQEMVLVMIDLIGEGVDENRLVDYFEDGRVVQLSMERGFLIKEVMMMEVMRRRLLRLVVVSIESMLLQYKMYVMIIQIMVVMVCLRLVYDVVVEKWDNILMLKY